MSFLGIFLGLIPGFVWLAFYLEEDPKPEPKRLIAYTFVLGCLSTIIALFLQIQAREAGLLASLTPDGIRSGMGFLALILLGFIEELCKFGAAYFAIHKAREFDEPIDAMIYVIVAALGFATIENIAVLQGQFSDQSFLIDILGVTSSRFVGATLLHALSAAFLGYYWALAKRHGKPSLIVVGIGVATVLHAGFNFLILNYESIVYPLILLIVGGFFALQDFEELKKKPA